MAFQFGNSIQGLSSFICLIASENESNDANVFCSVGFCFFFCFCVWGGGGGDGAAAAQPVERATPDKGVAGSIPLQLSFISG